MGDIKRKRKQYRHPKKPWDKIRIDAENIIVEEYGLKNKREIWKADADVSKIRRRAKALIGAPAEKQKALFDKLNKIGFKVSSTDDVLALTKEKLLERRLQTILFRKKMANTSKQARQLITHKHVFVDGRAVNKPSFIVTVDLEDKISLKEQKKPKKAAAPVVETTAEPAAEPAEAEKSEEKTENEEAAK